MERVAAYVRVRNLLPDANTVPGTTHAGVLVTSAPTHADIEAARDPLGNCSTRGDRPADGVRSALRLANAAAVFGVAGQDLLSWGVSTGSSTRESLEVGILH